MVGRASVVELFARHIVTAAWAVTVVTLSALSALGIAGCSRARLNAQVGEVQRETQANRQELERIDPALLEYHEAARFDTAFTEARGLALGPDGLVYVAGDQALRLFSPDGASQREFALSAAPYCLAVTEGRSIVVGLKDRVEIYGPDGARQAAWQPFGDRSYLTSVAVAGEEIYLADAGSRLIYRCTRSGEFLARIGGRDESRGVPGLLVPSPHLDVAVGADGLIRVNNPGRLVVETYTPTGDLKSSWGRASSDIDGFCGCCNPTDLALLPDGRVVTSEKGLLRVKVYAADGRLQAVVAGPDSFAAGTEGLDLAVDTQGRVFVLDPKSRQVVIFQPNEVPQE